MDDGPKSNGTIDRLQSTAAAARRPSYMICVALLLAAVAAVAAGPARAAALEAGPAGRVVEVIDGDTVILADGREVRLVGIQAPKLPLGRPGVARWPLADEAKAALAALVQGRRVEPRYGGLERDRHGRHLAHLYRDDSLWIQGALLRRGLARVYSFVDNRALIADMLAIEREARAAGRGIWSDPFYAVRSADEAAEAIGGFALVEGRVLAADIAGGRGYLNFGEDWETDFTIALERPALRLLEQTGIGIRDLAGRRVRVRGWVESWDGPRVEVTHPEQIELLGSGLGSAGNAPSDCIAGRLTDEGVECPAFRGRDGTLYTLLGDLGDLEPGDEACICGTEPAVSFCMQGTTLAVESIHSACPD